MKPTGTALKGNLPTRILEAPEKEDTVMARNNTVYLYSMMRGYRLPAEKFEKTLQFCFNKDVAFFIYGPSEREIRPAWALEIYAMINSGDNRLELIHTETAGGPIQVYRINKPESESSVEM